jgi:hypothetical protein
VAVCDDGTRKSATGLSEISVGETGSISRGTENFGKALESFALRIAALILLKPDAGGFLVTRAQGGIIVSPDGRGSREPIDPGTRP